MKQRFTVTKLNLRRTLDKFFNVGATLSTLPDTIELEGEAVEEVLDMEHK